MILEDLHVLGALSGFAVLVLAWGYPLWGGALHLLCPLRELTGIPCPTCFGTRALVAAAGGQWLAAIRYNPLVASAGFGLMVYVPWAVAATVAGWPRPSFAPDAIRRAAPLAGALVFLNWVYLLVAHA
jgi:hypothetical protein